MKNFKAFFAVIIASAALLSSCSSERETNADGFVMDSYAHIKVGGGDADKLMVISKSLDKVFSMFSDESDIYKINESRLPVVVSDDTINAIRETIKLSGEFGDRVDISVGRLTVLWNVTAENPKVPTQDEISQALVSTGLEKLEIDEQNKTVCSNGVMIDLGAVAKGYACDKLKAELELQNADFAIVTFGSSSLLYGEKPDGSLFSAAIKDPENPEKMLGILNTHEAFISTSGGYERYFEADGEEYIHIFDPETGYPAKTDLTSVTVVCSSGIKSDFLSTLIFIDGSENLEKYLNHKDFSIIAITDDKRVFISDSLKSNFKLSENSEYTVV